jgi:hypothetical protein
MHKHALVATARWEEQHIVEWIEYHRSIGFDHFYIYGHDNEPLTLYQVLFPYLHGPNPLVTYRYWPKPGEFGAMYLHFLRNHAHETEWFGLFDIGEYLTLRHVNDVAAFLAPFKRDWDSISFHGLNFAAGPNFPGSQLLARVSRGTALAPRAKTLTRSAAVDVNVLTEGMNRGLRPFWLGWDGYDMPHFRECDVLGVSMAGTSAEFPKAILERFAGAGIADSIIERGTITRISFNTLEELKRRLEYGAMLEQAYWEQVVAQGKLNQVIQNQSLVIDRTLADYWHRYTAPTLAFYAEPPRANPGPDGDVNVALGKTSWQSSILAVQPGETLAGEVAGAATNGRRTGSFGFHTQFQAKPWWIVDLRAPYRISAIRLYNRGDAPGVAARARQLRVATSVDGKDWKLLFAPERGLDFGGVFDQAPLEIKTPPNTVARYCRLSLDDTNYFHLDEVEIYGVLT